MQLLGVQQATSAGTVTIAMPSAGLLVGMSTTTTTAIGSDPAISVAGLQSPAATGLNSGLLAVATSGGNLFPTPFSVSQGELVYVAFSAKGSAVLYLLEQQ
jgi:hypothetical protein